MAIITVYVVNEKGKEYVGEMDGDVPNTVPSTLVFGEYTRDSAIMVGKPDRDDVAVTVVPMTGGTEVAGFHEYLQRRGKAAMANFDDGRVAMLPSTELQIAVYLPTPKRRRIDPEVTEEARRDGLVMGLPLWSQWRTTPETTMLFRDDASDREGCYFQDARRRYEFRCGRPGLRRLVALQEMSQTTSRLLDAELDQLDAKERERILTEGRRIYAEKPSLRKFADHDQGNVTWSNDEYAHAGLRAQYLRLKSLQRFTETYNLLHRAYTIDGTVKAIFDQSQLRIASLGGGPAFELVAVREFLAPRPLTLYSLDLQPAWKPYAEAVGCEFFGPFDVNKATPDSVIQACGGPLDVLVVSYLLIYCTNDHTADLFTQLLDRRLVKMLLISERTHNQDIVAMLQRRGLAVVPLMSQKVEIDQRQLLVLRGSDRRPLPPPATLDLLYPNVPFARGT